jgi:superfamily II DNA or RNA helicase
MREERRAPLEEGLYERVLTRELARAVQEAREAEALVETAPIESDVLPEVLGEVCGQWVCRVLSKVGESKREAVSRRILAGIFDLLGEEGEGVLEAGDAVSDALEQLRGVARPRPPRAAKLPPRPRLSFRTAALLTHGPEEPRLVRILHEELLSADRVRLIAAFIIPSGVRLLERALADFHARRGGEADAFSVLTSTYMGATESAALEQLVSKGAEVRVNYDPRHTRLHAKAWIFERDSGEHTALIGSSNLSHTALELGLEWNVRLSRQATPHLLERTRAAFASFWADERFEPFEAERFERAKRTLQRKETPGAGPFTLVSLHPHPFQERLLEEIRAQREVHGRHRNLLVAATGTGKTVVAALDYARLAEAAGRHPRLLFVAHRKEILEQARSHFRHALQDAEFGELLLGGERPDRWSWVFASVQSLQNVPAEQIPPSHFEVVIVDEFHHAAAATYERWLTHLEPRELLGLTATPERADGRSVLHWFGGRIAAELRLWEALEEGLLCPFQYFGVHDGVDLSAVRWQRGGYALGDLEKLYLGAEQRLHAIFGALRNKLVDPRRMRALGYCVGVEHARFMAERFRKQGFEAVALTGEDDAERRARVLRDLRRGTLSVVFTVDLLNEGVDLPEVDTLLLLRPTESTTLFLQQLGRGLRRHREKRCLTVLDFIGTPRREFRFLDRYRALLPGTRREVHEALQEGLPPLPPGCLIDLDRDAHRLVLQNVKAHLGVRRDVAIEEAGAFASGHLRDFLARLDLGLEEFYGEKKFCLTRLRRAAGRSSGPEHEDEERLARAIPRMLHVDDAERIEAWTAILRDPTSPESAAWSERERRMALGLVWLLHGVKPRHQDFAAAFRGLREMPELRREMIEMLEIRREQLDRLTFPLTLPTDAQRRVPLRVHAHYARDEIVAAFALAELQKSYSLQAGVRFDSETRTDLLLVTHAKSEREFSPTTLYRDFAISPVLFHWESQNTTREGSPTGRRYRHHAREGSNVLLFARERKKSGALTMPYLCLGLADFVTSESERPMRITWRLRTPMPQTAFRVLGAGA